MPLSESFFWRREIRFLVNIFLFFLRGTEPPEEGVQFKPHLPSQGIVLDEVEKHYILEALKIKKGNKLQAAKMLGISRSALLYRMQKHGITSWD